MAKGGSGAAASKTGKRKKPGKASKIGGANKKRTGKAPRIPKNRSAGIVSTAKKKAAKAKSKAKAKTSTRGSAARKVKVPPRRVRK